MNHSAPRLRVRRSWLGWVLLLGVFGMAAGCASIPDQSQAQPVANQPTNDIGLAISGPQPNVDQYSLVREFVQASAETGNNYRVPRSFLSPEGRRLWDPTSQVTVVGNDLITTLPSSTTNVSNLRSVLVRATKLGTLDADGTFSPAQSKEAYVQSVTVERQTNQQWRIKYLQDGLVLRLDDFQRAYQQVSLDFVEPRLQAPIPDVRYYPRGSTTQVAEQIVNGLINGASTTLQPAVTDSFGSVDKKAKAHVVQSSPDLLTVDLPSVGDASDAQKKGMIDEIVRSLRGVVGGSVELRAQGQLLDPAKPRYQFSDLPSYNLFVPVQQAGPLYVQGDVLKSLPPNDDTTSAPEDDDAKKLDAMTGLSDCAAASGARSLDGEQVAVVCTGRDGTQRMRVGQFGKDVREVAGLQGKTLTRPTFPPGSTNSRVGYEVWTVADGRNIVRVHRNGDVWQPTAVDASQLFDSGLIGRGGKIDTFRLSRDGVRAAIVVEGKLIVCTVLRNGDQVQLVSPILITNKLENVHDVDWTSQTQMAVVFDADSDGNAESIATVSVDGLYSTPMPTTNMSPPLTNIAAAPGQQFIAVSDKSTFTSVSSGSSWIPLGNLGQDAVPFYAG